jgi:hypothetical protein
MSKRYEVHSEHVRGERRYYWVRDSLTGMSIVGSHDKRVMERICSKRNALHRAGGKGMIVMPANSPAPRPQRESGLTQKEE